MVQCLWLSTFTAVAWVQSLVRELRSHKPCGVAKKKKIFFKLHIEEITFTEEKDWEISGDC